jgi:hypothetical protein
VSNDFEDLNMPDEDFGISPIEGMPDPTADAEAPAVPLEPEPEQLDEPEETSTVKAKGGGKMALFARADLFTVLLAVSLAAVLIGVFCLVMEWGRYAFERNPKVGAAAPVSRDAVCLDHPIVARSGDHVVG